MWLTFILAVSACCLGVWELVVTRTASILFFYDVTYLVLAACLLALGGGALSVRLLAAPPGLGACFVMLPLSLAICWVLLYHFALAWTLGVFALPFALFGVIAVLAWIEVRDHKARAWLYGAEVGGTILGILLFGPLVVAAVPVNVLGEIGVLTHLKETVSREGLIDHQHHTDSVARTDIISTSRDSVRYFFTDGMFVTRSVKWDGESPSFADPHVENLASLKRLAFSSSSLEKVALLGAGAGFDIAVALQEGARHVDAVEINNATITAALRLEDWSGGVLTDRRVKVHVDDARRFIESSDQRWNHINLTLLQTSPATTRGRQHMDARTLTVEAFSSYVDKLEPGGVISIIQNSIQLASLTEQTVTQLPGVQLRRFVLRETQENPFSHLLLVSPTGFTPTEDQLLDTLAQSSGATRPDTFISNPASKPATDDRPFLFESAGPLGTQTGLLLALTLFGLGTWFWFRRADSTEIRFSVMAILIGTGTLAVQVIALYRCQSAIGSPVTSLAVGLGAALGGAGTGVLIVRTLIERIPWHLTGILSAATASLLTLTGAGVADFASASTNAAIIMFCFVFLCALPMGIPFLVTINRSSQLRARGEAVVIGFDGIGSVVGALGATMLAVSFGFTALGVATVGAFLLFSALTRWD